MRISYYNFSTVGAEIVPILSRVTKHLPGWHGYVKEYVLTNEVFSKLRYVPLR